MPDEERAIDDLMAAGPARLDPVQRAQLAEGLRRRSPDVSRRLVAALFEKMDGLAAAVEEASEKQEEFKKVLDELTAPPWYAGVFLGPQATARGPRALVMHGNTRLVVGMAEGVTPDSLKAGDEVWLGSHLNVIMGRSPGGVPPFGETAAYQRRTGDGRLVVESRGEEFVVQCAGALDVGRLRAGDLVRWDRVSALAFEKLERSQGRHLFLEETPTETFASVGGHGAVIQRLQRAVVLHLKAKDIVRKYQMPPKRGILLFGPVGTGKTMLARALANWAATLTGSGRCRFMNIKPGQLRSMWYGMSEAQYREVFRVAKEAGADDPDVPVIMFFDEVDSIGGVRGESLMRVDDRVLQAFLAELDGLESRGNILVIGATNRMDVVDPALARPGRLGDVVLEVPRPNRAGAREIFERHLSADIPYAMNGHGSDSAAMRAEIIDSAVSAIYSSNGESATSTLIFRDGKRREVRRSDLVSGAVISNIVSSAKERAVVRESEGGPAGLGPDDVLRSLSEEFDTAARVLTPRNCRNYLAGLPQDMEVVGVEPVVRKVARPQDYIRLEAE